MFRLPFFLTAFTHVWLLARVDPQVRVHFPSLVSQEYGFWPLWIFRTIKHSWQEYGFLLFCLDVSSGVLSTRAQPNVPHVHLQFGGIAEIFRPRVTLAGLF